MKIMISGGGTGGHIFPALAIADALKLADPASNILFVGAKGRMEMEKVPAAGYPIQGLWITGLHRKKMWRNITFPVKLASSLMKSYRLIRRFRPDVVIGVGGFASGPILEVASRMGVPTLIQEQNSYAGLTNKLLGHKADRICVAFQDMEKYFPVEKLTITGNPVRQGLLKADWTRESAKRELGITGDQKVVLAVGGSLGARTINRMFAQNSDAIAACPDVHFIWQYGALYEEEYANAKTTQLANVSAVKFIDDMACVYAAADLVVARAGALTLAELAALGKAAVLIPSPNVAEDHQTKNAMKLVEADAAELLADEDAGEHGLGRIIQIVKQNDRLRTLEQNIRPFYRSGAAQKIAREVIKLASKS